MTSDKGFPDILKNKLDTYEAGGNRISYARLQPIHGAPGTNLALYIYGHLVWARCTTHFLIFKMEPALPSPHKAENVR